MDMISLVESILGPPVRSKGNTAKWHCPTGTHDDRDASFVVYPDHAHCYGCNWHGGDWKFLHDIAGWSKERIQRWRDGYNVPIQRRERPRHVGIKAILPPHREWQKQLGDLVTQAHHTLMDNARWAWMELNHRGIGREVWARYRLGYNPDWVDLGFAKLAPGIVLPAYFKNVLWSVNVRVQSGRPKYCRPEDPRVGYGVYAPFGLEQLQGHNTLIIAESELDACAAAQAVGQEADVIGLRGTGNWVRLDAWMPAMPRYRRIVVCLDDDKAGRKARDELRLIHPRWAYRTPPDGLDMCKMVQAGIDLKAFLLDQKGQ